MRSHRGIFSLGAFSLAICVAFALLHPLLLSGERFLGWDAVRESWGDLLYGARAVSSGQLPLWNPHERGGYPFLADPQSALLYPPTWLIWIGITLVGGGLWVPLARTLIHLLIGALGTRALLQRWAFSPPACFFGGAFFVLGGRVLKAKDSAGLWSPVWLPWGLWAIDRMIKRPTTKTGLMLGLVTALACLSGYPPNVFRSLLFEALIACWLLARHLPTLSGAERISYLRQLSRALIIGVGLCVTLYLPQIIATLEQLPYTVRSKVSLGEVLMTRLTLSDIVDLLTPRLIHDKSYALIYMGLGPAFLALYAIRARWRRWGFIWGGSALIFFLLACGKRGGVLPVLAKHIPGFGLWRIAEQYLFITSFALACLAALGLSLLQRERRLPPLIAYWLPALTIILTLFGLTLRWYQGMTLAGLPLQTGLTTIALAIFWPLILRLQLSTKRRRAGLIGLALLLLIDLGIQHRPIHEILQRTPSTKRDRELPERVLGERIVDQSYFRWRVGARSGHSELFGRYSTMVSARYKRFQKDAERNPKLLAAAGAHFYAGRGGKRLKKKSRRLVKRVKGQRYQIKGAPYAYWSDRAELAHNGRTARIWLRKRQVGEMAIFEEHYAPTEIAKRYQLRGDRLQKRARKLEPARAAELLTRDWNEVELIVDAPRAGALIVNEAWAPGWYATIDGIEAPIYRANFLFQGLWVEAGRHRIHLKYRPRAVLLSLIPCGFAWLFIGFTFSRRSSPDRGEDHPRGESSGPFGAETERAEMQPEVAEVLVGEPSGETEESIHQPDERSAPAGQRRAEIREEPSTFSGEMAAQGAHHARELSGREDV
ncbi:MAG: hypothetical protein VYD19_01220 [Myxococcota bacterium]|nr:hypothetical protein [Myxococcota bacterium]